ncbi:MAG: hypothetical protein M1812_005412 [Candelaria pacifica]|nr:MAG: hypothetical protein M1812_005412 [Candelaria pacifica]
MSIDNPLLTALPPKTDYPTYLILLEYNLTPALLPTLHHVLQDSTLTTNIGWDLIHLLLPLLPASELCLNDVARLGNPREVVLKVTESLRQIDFGVKEQDVESEPETSEEPKENELLGSMQRKLQADDAESRETQVTGGATSSTLAGSSNTVAEPEEATLPLPILQFTSLISLLSIVHPRIKTKYPSRFLSMTLQAVLATYNEAVRTSHTEDVTSAVLRFIKTLSGSKRPHLPPRQSSSQVPKASKDTTAPDPEAQTEPPSSNETAIQSRLLQSLLTHILEDYILSLSSNDDILGLAWASRFNEKANPERIVPGRITYGEQFAKKEALRSRDTTVGQMIALARDLGIKSEDLLLTFQNLDTTIDTAASIGEESDPPTSVEDIPLSRAGALYLFAARIAAAQLFESSVSFPMFDTFPHHAIILKGFIGTDVAGGIGSAGTESPALIDTILALGLYTLHNTAIGSPEDDDQFTQYLQTLSILSANAPSPTLRYHAHVLTSQILHSHPSDLIRLSFIRDTLEHCPYEPLKESAISWLKTEILASNPSPPQPTSPQSLAANSIDNETEIDNERSIFATPIALDTLAPFLFPSLTPSLLQQPLTSAYQTFKLNLGFYLAVTNLSYLLFANANLRQKLDLQTLLPDHNIVGSFIEPLSEAIRRFRKVLNGEIKNETENTTGLLVLEDGEEGKRRGIADLSILDERIGLVRDGIDILLNEPIS